MRCTMCDFLLGAVGPQSNFFNALPPAEKNKRRFSWNDKVSGEQRVGCSDCAGHVESERRNNMSVEQLIHLRDLYTATEKILKDAEKKGV